ncbi:hypothetical protein EDD22DRAFT_924078 [Suillus occidentalis]|nr:hypothetical protein EDD22DRAFT_924078 [Suillus occidentalis]
MMARRNSTTPALAVCLIRLFAVKIVLTSNAAVQRKEQQYMLPHLWDDLDDSDEETRTVKIWRPLRPGRPTHISNMDWKEPRP